MSPRAFTNQVVVRRLALMSEMLDDLSTIGEVDERRLHDDRVTRRAIERILTQLIDLAVDINTHAAVSLDGAVITEYRESFDAAARLGLVSVDLVERLKSSVGLRNVLVHEYVDTNLELVAAAVPKARDDYGEYVSSVARWLRQQP